MQTTLGWRMRWAVGAAAVLAAGAAFAGNLWTENAQEAMARAATEKKDLLVLFTGSDWCPWCRKLDAEILSQPAFQAEAPKRFVLLLLDFPKKREMPDETKKQNAEWTQKFKCHAYPTVFLADATGQQYAKTGYKPGGPDAYLKNLADLQQAHGGPGAGTTQTNPVQPSVNPGGAFGGGAADLWTENAQEAMARAAAEKKDLLIDFTGSDWCGWCKKLDAEVFSQPAFQAEAPKHFVLLKLDFPHQRPLSDETKKQNAEWQAKFGIQGYPTIILADATGKQYAKTGYKAGGPEAYLKQLDILRQAHPTAEGRGTLPPVGGTPAGGPWTEDAREALARAAAEKKDLLIDFTGSDWCPWCKKLDEEVFSQPDFQAEAGKQFVFLKLDFPHQRPLSDEMKKQNAEWQTKFQINAFPTVLLVDAAGKPYAKTGYRAGGPQPYLKQLAALRRLHDSRDWALAQAKAPEMAAAKLLDKALAALDPSLIPGGYADVVQQIIALDADNMAGLKSKYETMLLTQRIMMALGDRKVDEALALADEALKATGDSGQPAQEIYWAKYIAYSRNKDKAAAKQALEAALKAAPSTPKAAQIRQLLDRVFKE